MPKPKKSRILVVDDHPAMREGLRAILHTEYDLVICGEADSMRQAVAAVETLKPDLAIVDISLREEFDGIDLTRQLHDQWPGLRVLAYSLNDQQSCCDAALAAGAHGYCVKTESSKTLIHAVRSILRGKSFVSNLLEC